VSYRGGAGKINFADEGRKGTRKKRAEYQRGVSGRAVAVPGWAGIGGKGVARGGGASSPLARAAYRSPHRNSNLFGPFFRATCR